MFGKNPRRKQELNPFLWVTSIFQTIQGEGPWAGSPAVFVRLAGCNLACYWCDTQFETGMYYTADEVANLVDNVRSPGTQLVVITGGEPFRQDIRPLLVRLAERTYNVQIETAGTLTLPDFPWNYCELVVSPKTGKVHPDICQRAIAWKYIVAHGDEDPVDGLPFMSTQVEGKDSRIARPPPDWVNNLAEIYVQPRDDYSQQKNKRNVDHAVRICLKYGYRLSIQVHKIIGVD